MEKEARKQELESDRDFNIPLIKTEFRCISSPSTTVVPALLSPTSILSSPTKSGSRNNNNNNNKENKLLLQSPQKRPRVCFAKLDSFPNYVVDGMRLPHVCSRIRIKLRPKDDKPFVWTLSPEVKQMAIKVQAANDSLTTPTRNNSKGGSSSKKTPSSSTRKKRRKFCDESNNNSPKILQFFPVLSSVPASPSSPAAVSSFSSMEIKNDEQEECTKQD